MGIVFVNQHPHTYTQITAPSIIISSHHNQSSFFSKILYIISMPLFRQKA